MTGRWRRPLSSTLSPAGAGERESCRGFTLLEVVVALAILAMGLMAISDVVGGALRNHVRAHDLDVATLLARAKLAQLEDQFDEDGFRDFDQDEEGTFEDQGHGEVRWAWHVTRPALEGGGDAACTKLLGDYGLSSLLPQPKDAGAASTPTDPIQAAIANAIKAQCSAFTETVKKGVRRLHLTVTWGKGSDPIELETYLVVITPRKGQP
ncbi:MAG TPA: prepilin-type N-terminal cleavage/methylation domain-containing protein [Anaeromyxobacteraceae bacterium]|nr:prepilin-type N-terminal cleavage/methylation domain-containing protein [Anaeromyxobacteraceae bacterium]